jgi:L-lysine exporter family protein LysE/ArgO
VLTSAAAGFAASAVLIIAIGAQNAFVLRQGLRREHVLAVVAICAGSDLVLISAGIAGLGALVSAHPATVTAIKWAGAAFLITYALLAAKRALSPAALAPSERGPATLRATVLTCLAMTWLNPHVYLDTVLLLGSVAQQHPDRWSFGAGAGTASIVWFTGLGLAAGRLAPVLERPAAWRVLDGTIAVVMAALGLGLLF